MSIRWRVSEREHPQKCHFLYFLERPLQQFCTTVQTVIVVHVNLMKLFTGLQHLQNRMNWLVTDHRYVMCLLCWVMFIKGWYSMVYGYLWWQLCDIISKWEQDYLHHSGSRSDLTRTIRLLYKSRYSHSVADYMWLLSLATISVQHRNSVLPACRFELVQ